LWANGIFVNAKFFWQLVCVEEIIIAFLHEKASHRPTKITKKDSTFEA